MFKKICPTPAYCFAPDKQYDLVRKLIQTESGLVVSYEEVSCEDRSKEQLDPQKMNIDSMIASGTVIEPGNIAQLLNPTDRASIDAHDYSQYPHIEKFINEHHDEIVESLKSK